jgi:hypothetical protein
MYAANEVFVTGDAEFVEYVLDKRPRHAGVVYVPQSMTSDEKRLFAEIAGGYIRGAVAAAGQFSMRRSVVNPGDHGLRRVEADGNDRLVISWDRFEQMLE